MKKAGIYSLSELNDLSKESIKPFISLSGTVLNVANLKGSKLGLSTELEIASGASVVFNWKAGDIMDKPVKLAKGSFVHITKVRVYPSYHGVTCWPAATGSRLYEISDKDRILVYCDNVAREVTKPRIVELLKFYRSTLAEEKERQLTKPSQETVPEVEAQLGGITYFKPLSLHEAYRQLLDTQAKVIYIGPIELTITGLCGISAMKASYTMNDRTMPENINLSIFDGLGRQLDLKLGHCYRFRCIRVKLYDGKLDAVAGCRELKISESNELQVTQIAEIAPDNKAAKMIDPLSDSDTDPESLSEGVHLQKRPRIMPSENGDGPLPCPKENDGLLQQDKDVQIIDSQENSELQRAVLSITSPQHSQSSQEFD